MKRIFLTLVLFFILPTTVFAGKGESNFNSGGGRLGKGTRHSYWIPGNEGVRITVVNSKNGNIETPSFDLSNVRPNVDFFFGFFCKLYYTRGNALFPRKNYVNFKPNPNLPQIISDIGSDSRTNINELKNYFCDERVVKYISELTNISFQNLTSGKYKLLIEPVVYIKFLGNDFAMTATEAALFNKKTSGQLYAWMRSLTHQNLPLSMFLEKDALGFSAYHGDTTGLQSDDFIFNNLGLGIVSFTGDVVDINRTNNSYTYRTDTEVITPVSIFSNDEISPKDPAIVTFSIDGKDYSTKTVVPEKQYQLVWVKWRTPSTPKRFTIDVRTDKGKLCQEHIPVTVVDKQINTEPPDPKATDAKKSIRNKIPPMHSHNTASWDVWVPVKHNDRQWRSNWSWDNKWVDSGSWNDHVWYDYKKVRYTASITPNLNICSDDITPNRKDKIIKSGYGVKCQLKTSVKTNAPFHSVTAPQHAEMFFPEFNYSHYSRVLSLDNLCGKNSIFCFSPNKFSTYNRRAHYIPLWFPDQKYTVLAQISECWTPAGMLSTNVQDNVCVSGNMYSDWHNAIA